MTKSCVVSVDVENDSGTTTGTPTFESVRGTDLIMEVFRRNGVERPTLFVTGELLDRFPDRVRAWAREAEIASHGYHHVPVPTLDRTERKRQMALVVAAHEKHLGERPRGYRAVQHTLDALQAQIVRESGFRYDSSVVPRYPPYRRYVGFRGKAPTEPYSQSMDDPRKQGPNGLTELPVTGGAFEIPLNGTWLRTLGMPVAASLHLSRRSYMAITMHNWDAVGTDGRYARNCGSEFLRRLDRLLRTAQRRGYRLHGCERAAAAI